jgi:hypothetical protein
LLVNAGIKYLLPKPKPKTNTKPKTNHKPKASPKPPPEEKAQECLLPPVYYPIIIIIRASDTAVTSMPVCKPKASLAQRNRISMPRRTSAALQVAGPAQKSR